MELTKLPAPVPSEDLLFKIVGLDDVPQQTPLAVIAAPPEEAIFPPDNAVFEVMDEIELVVRAAVMAEVVKVCSAPYAVPILLMAYVLT
jgi:hypothetical protein